VSGYKVQNETHMNRCSKLNTCTALR